jgi:hypothetical protein
MRDCGLALSLSVQVIYRQELKDMLPHLYVSLGLGVGLWFIAEAIWAYYELVAAIETPFHRLPTLSGWQNTSHSFTFYLECSRIS